MAKKELLGIRQRLFGKYLIYYREGKIERDKRISVLPTGISAIPDTPLGGLQIPLMVGIRSPVENTTAVTDCKQHQPFSIFRCHIRKHVWDIAEVIQQLITNEHHVVFVSSHGSQPGLGGLQIP